ncbi:MAG TPA: hypothetical protein VFJ01_01625 [Oleiagrimonas sp.]|nr:hypothetical protein [Oleiagrimonas sp.]
MRIVTRIIAISRATRLGREFREIDGIIQGLSHDARQKLALFALRELAQAGRCEFPHLYGTSPEKRYAVWGSGAETGLTRARSDNPQVRLRGIALWLAVIFHETRDSEHAQIAAVHRQILRVLRQLKQSVPENTVSNTWAGTAEAAA